MQILIDNINMFTFDFYQKTKATPKNIFCSPYSIYNALVLADVGAGGNTARQIEAVLHLERTDNPHYALQKLQLDVNNNSENQLKMASALWLQKNYNLLPNYLRQIENTYGDSLHTVDFAQAPDESVIEINRWVSDKTQNRITELLGPRSISGLTRMILTNAIYFKAHWHSTFKSVESDTFYTLDEEKIIVPMMNQSTIYKYAKGDNYQVIDIPYMSEYLNDGLSMLIILPDKGQFSRFENSLDRDKLNSILISMKRELIILFMPKFNFNSNYELPEYLQALGMTDGFSRNADFSRMTDISGLFLENLTHSTFISVDEYETEAGALDLGTVTFASPGRKPPKFIKLLVNRPFIFLIRDIKTGIVLFIGRVLNPLT
jgi:serpin B